MEHGEGMNFIFKKIILHSFFLKNWEVCYENKGNGLEI